MTFYAHTKLGSGRDAWQELRVHLQEVATTTSRLARKIGLSRAGELIGLAHDLGKYSEAFQQYLRQAADNASMEMEPDHLLRETLHKFCDPGLTV
jgi:CRISPR-associated endonuclease/helicase Cas3